MDRTTAETLVRSFLRRLKKHPDEEGAYALRDDGIISAEERTALAVLCGTPADTMSSGPAIVRRPAAELKLESVTRNEPSLPGITMCLDFGTALSKAWASKSNLSDTYPAFLATEAGFGEGLPLVSSLYFGSNGQIYFGEQAVIQSLAAEGRRSSDNARFDNLKRELSEGITGADLDNALMPESVNHTSTALTKGDAIILYLAYLTDLATRNLGRQILNWSSSSIEVRRSICREVGVDQTAAENPQPPNAALKPLRYLRRRFAMPCYAEDREAWMRPWMQSAILRAQIVADTLEGRWSNLSAIDAKDVLDQVRALATDGKLPTYLLHSDAGVKEPIAAMAARFGEDGGPEDYDSGAARGRSFTLVIDAGAGTTDFAVFMVVPSKEDEIHRYFTITPTVKASLKAGNAVDGGLRRFIEQKYNIGGTSSRLIGGDLEFFRSELELRLRRIKEALMSGGVYRGPIGGYVNLDLTADEFLRSDEMADLERDLRNERDAALGAIGDGLINHCRTTGQALRVNVMLTGGTSRLPMFRAIATGDIVVKGARMHLSLIDGPPRWLARRGDEALLTVFPQCAVAIGGTVEHLPEDCGPIPEFVGGRPRLGPLERFPSRGL